jgi:hypothetical protein
MPVLHGLVRMEEEHERCLPRVPVCPDAPRAMFIGLFRMNPGGVTRPSFWERPLYPPLADSHTGCAVFGIRTPQTRRALWHTASAPGAMRLGPPDCACVAPSGHRRLAPPSRTPPEDAPPTSKVSRNIIHCFLNVNTASILRRWAKGRPMEPIRDQGICLYGLSAKRARRNRRRR